jgi:hypothetical protein
VTGLGEIKTSIAPVGHFNGLSLRRKIYMRDDGGRRSWSRDGNGCNDENRKMEQLHLIQLIF